MIAYSVSRAPGAVCNPESAFYTKIKREDQKLAEHDIHGN
jgi:hypothetical protein